MGVRLYNPAPGRFLQTDPKPNGTTSPYGYCAADPINAFDLDGQWSWGGVWNDVKHVATTVAKATVKLAPVITVAALFVPGVDFVALGVEAINLAATGKDVADAVKARTSPQDWITVGLDVVGFGVAGKAIKTERELQAVEKALETAKGVKKTAASRRLLVALEHQAESLRLRSAGWSARDRSLAFTGLGNAVGQSYAHHEVGLGLHGPQ
jgi:hypothetical protein